MQCRVIHFRHPMHAENQITVTCGSYCREIHQRVYFRAITWPGLPARTSQAVLGTLRSPVHWVAMTLDEHMKDVSDKVDLTPFIHLYWLDALGVFAASARLRIGLRRIVTIDDEIWFINHDGDLVMAASIGPEALRMVIPRGLWEWL